MPTREQYSEVIHEYQRQYPATDLVFFLCVDNSDDLAYYQRICSPYPTLYTEIRRSGAIQVEPHLSTIGTERDIADAVVEVELCAMCDVLIHPVTNMATTSLFMNPVQISRYLHV
jgi:hypothetical protein